VKPTFRPGDRIIYATTGRPIEMSTFGDWVNVCPVDEVAMDHLADDGSVRCPVCQMWAADLPVGAPDVH
jgi:hypothetical protein